MARLDRISYGFANRVGSKLISVFSETAEGEIDV